ELRQALLRELQVAVIGAHLPGERDAFVNQLGEPGTGYHEQQVGTLQQGQIVGTPFELRRGAVTKRQESVRRQRTLASLDRKLGKAKALRRQGRLQATVAEIDAIGRHLERDR